MKKLIILIVILIITSLSGQEYPDSSRMGSVKGWSKTSNEYFCIMILGSWDLYTKECYADSTFVISGGGYEMDYPVVNDTLNLTESMSRPAIYIVKRRWEHRQPTFQGFIEFIRRKKDEVNK